MNTFDHKSPRLRYVELNEPRGTALYATAFAIFASLPYQMDNSIRQYYRAMVYIKKTGASGNQLNSVPDTSRSGNCGDPFPEPDPSHWQLVAPRSPDAIISHTVGAVKRVGELGSSVSPEAFPLVFRLASIDWQFAVGFLGGSRAGSNF